MVNFSLCGRITMPLHLSTIIGAAYAHAEEEIQEFVIRSNLPFLPTPMGKGVISDTHPLSVAAARSK